MKKSILLWQLLGCLLILSSCSNKSPKEAAYIPKKASFVMGLDMAQLQQKVNEGGMSADSLISLAFDNDSSSQQMKKMVMEGKNESGINWNEKIFLFVNQQDFPDRSTATSVNVLSNTTDMNKLEKYLLKQEEFANKEIKREKNYSYIQGEKDLQVSWNKDVCIITYFMHPTIPVYDTLEMTFKEAMPADIPKESKAETDLFFTQKTTESLASVDAFNKMFSENADGFLFTSSNSSLSQLRKLPFNPPKLEELLKDNYTTAILHFEKGKLRIQSMNYTNPAVSNILSKYGGPVVNFSLVKDYPSKDINLVTLVSFNPEIIGGLLKHIELESFANNFLNKSGLSMQEVYKAFKGELAVVVSDVKYSTPDPMMKRDELSLENGLPTGNLLARIPVGDLNSYRKIMDMGVNAGLIQKTGNQYHSNSKNGFASLFILGDDKNLYIASDSSLYSNYLASAGKPNSFFTQSPINKYTAASTLFYMNISSTIHGLVPDSTKSGYSRILYQLAGTCKELVASTDNFDGKSTNSQAELLMKNTEKNSLVSLLYFLTNSAKIMQEEREESNITLTDLSLPEKK